MSEILSFVFMQNALIASVLISVICGVVGTLVVINRIVFIAGGIAHGSYGGLGIAFYFGFAPIFGIFGFAFALALLIANITLNKNNSDAIIGAIWAFGMAVGIILTDLTPGYNVDLMSYLFGSIVSISSFDLWLIFSVDIIVLIIVISFYRHFQAMSFDMEFALLKGVNVRALYYVLIALIALSVVATIQAVGLILVIALLSIPPFIAEKFCVNLSTMMVVSGLLSVFFCISGLFLSYFYNLSSGASIIMIASISFFISIIAYKIK